MYGFCIGMLQGHKKMRHQKTNKRVRQLNATIIMCRPTSLDNLWLISIPFSILRLRKISQPSWLGQKTFSQGKLCQIELQICVKLYWDTAYGPIQMSSYQEQPSSKILVCKILIASYISSCCSYNMHRINPSNIQLVPLYLSCFEIYPWYDRIVLFYWNQLSPERTVYKIKVFQQEELFWFVVFGLI